MTAHDYSRNDISSVGRCQTAASRPHRCSPPKFLANTNKHKRHTHIQCIDNCDCTSSSSSSAWLYTERKHTHKDVDEERFAIAAVAEYICGIGRGASARQQQSRGGNNRDEKSESSLLRQHGIWRSYSCTRWIGS